MNAIGSSVDSSDLRDAGGPARQIDEPIGARHGLRRKRQHEAFGDAELLLDVIERVSAALETRELGRRLDRLRQRAEAIH